jgi:hypothetical protein
MLDVKVGVSMYCGQDGNISSLPWPITTSSVFLTTVDGAISFLEQFERIHLCR